MIQQSLTWSEFEERFKPIKNHFSNDPDQTMFETYGEEVEHVGIMPYNRVWTYVDTEVGTAVYNGYHYINRIGYYITEVPWQDLDEFEVDLEINTCENCGEPREFTCQEDDGELTCAECCGHEECA